MLQKQVVHRGYSATERQLGHIYGGWRIVARRKIPRFLRWYYDGKVWEFIGQKWMWGRTNLPENLDVSWERYPSKGE